MALGSVAIALKDVLAQPDLVLDRWLTLEGALPESQILLRATLKVPSSPRHTASTYQPPLRS